MPTIGHSSLVQLVQHQHTICQAMHNMSYVTSETSDYEEQMTFQRERDQTCIGLGDI